MSQAYAEPPDTQIENPCEGGRCRLDQETGAWEVCKKHRTCVACRGEFDTYDLIEADGALYCADCTLDRERAYGDLS